ncbi:hypothetical protein GF351_05685 [Candidatus Woesearchaeota archaeon]|nr:hypothetical protein [Candidatus Woesearchaeota archaeon]
MRSTKLLTGQRRSRKGGIELSSFIGIIFSALIILTIMIPMAIAIYNFFVDKGTEEGTLKSMYTLAVETDNIIDERIVPVYIDKKHFIKAFRTGGPGDGCKENTCFCVCTQPGCSSEGDEVVECEPTEQMVDRDYLISPLLDEEGKAVVQNCRLVLRERQVAITDCT